MPTLIPDWFTAATQAPRSDHWVESSGARIHYQVWNEDSRGKPAIFLIHGHAANAHWWDFIAPLLRDRMVIAIDVSGSGDSEHRHAYSMQDFVQEVLDVRQQAAANVQCYLLGHSFGGRIARSVAAQAQSAFVGTILVDSAISLPGHQSRFKAPEPSHRPVRYYSSRREAARRFRLRPPQPCQNDYIVEYIAAHSVRAEQGRWCWKLDQNVFARMRDLKEPAPADAMLRSINRIAIIYGEHSRFFSREVVEYISTLIPPHCMTRIRDAHHHLFLDQPLHFVSALVRQLDQWDHEL